ncbi:MAG: ATP-binding protein [Microscillaceae bacterium]|nr:ATP-binding protein [Microscillaceae bacterium]
MIHYYKASCSRDNLKLIRKFVEAVLFEMPLGDIETNQLILAVDEVCANQIIHTYKCNPTKSIEIVIRDEAPNLVFEIINDEGSQFDLTGYQDPSLQNIVKERRKGGIGLMLVHKIMDKVEVDQQETKCTWRLVKKINPKVDIKANC